MISTHATIGRQLLVALISNDEPEFVRILNAHCLQIRGNRFDREAEIRGVLDQIREAEIALGLDYDLATWKMARSQMNDRLAANREERLAA